MGFARRRLAELLVGGAGCLGAAWVALALRAAWSAALLQAEGAKLAEGRFGRSVALPSDAPRLLHAAAEFGPLLAALLLFAASVGLARRLPAAGAIVASAIAFWTAVPICAELLLLGWSRHGALGLLMRSVGIPLGGAAARQAVAAVAVLGLLAALRWAWRGVGRSALTGVAAPAFVSCFVFASSVTGLPARGGSALDAYPWLLAVAAATAVSFPPAGWRTVRMRRPGMIAMACAAAAALWLPVPRQSGPPPAGSVERASGRWRVHFEAGRFTEARMRGWLVAADRRLDGYRSRLGLSAASGPVPLRVVASERSLDRQRPGFRPGGQPETADGSAVVALMGGRDGLPEDPRLEVLAAMRQEWGRPASSAMALAIARYAMGEYRGASLADAAVRVACEERRYEEADVFGAAGGYLSPLVRDIVGGAWVEECVRRRGSAVLPVLYGQDLGASTALCAGCVPGCRPADAPARRADRLPAYLKGISFSHEGRGAEGYGSAAAEGALRDIARAGANAVALVPYAFTAAPQEAAIRFRTLETDARVMRAAGHARDSGLLVMLKPHLWAGRRFHGSIEFRDESRFLQWFGDYRRWMLHYARLAESAGFDLLSLGNELAGLTGRERSWRSLIAEVRRVYRGPLTYSAHWDRELANLSFWDALDYIGVNFYFPIAARGEPPRPGSPAIRRAARVIESVSERFGKPVLFTEVGFPALATAASRPWEENGSPLDARLQAQCYEVWFDQFAKLPHVRGMFWWKWPSHGRGSPFDPSHRPLGKPAAEVLSTWFSRLPGGSAALSRSIPSRGG